MARLTDPEKLMCYRNALKNWRYRGFIRYAPLALDWLEKLAVAPGDFSRILYDFVLAGGEIDQVVEVRPEWSVHDFHYDLRPTLNGQVIYVETRLKYQDATDPDDPVINVVNIHIA